MKDKNKFSILNYFKEKKLLVCLYVLLDIVSYLFNIVATLKLAQFLELISAANYTAAINCFLITAICIIGSRITVWISSICFYSFGRHLSTSIKRDLLERCLNFDSNSFNRISSGKLNTRISSDPENIVWAMDGLVESLSQAMSGIVSVVFIASYNLWIGIIIAVTILSLIVFETYKQKLWTKNTKALNKCNERLSTYSNEIIRSEKDIKSLNMEESLKEQSKTLLNDYSKSFSKRFQTNGHLWTIRSGIVDLVVIGIVFLSIHFLENAYLAISSFLFIILNKDQINNLIWTLGRITENLNTCKISSKRINTLMDEKKFQSEKFGTQELPNCKGEIELRNVSFSYEEIDLNRDDDDKIGEKKDANKKQVFKNFSMKIPANTTVALVGRSGCGKSTILNLIPKLYTVDDGEVLIDGVNVNDLSQNALRENISLVSQFPYIFDKTIKENLLLAKPNATEKEINDVVKKANMDFLDDMPKGIDTLVGEGGIKLSGGQKQRLAIARALLRNSRIILFDESTSSLDNFSQNEIKKSIDALSHNSTVVIVAHRLSTIKNADIIYFIDNGKIEAQGTFDELFDTNEKFQKLFVAENI